MAVRQMLIADRYRLHEPVGTGGMGRIWAARDEVLDRDVAVKEFVPPDWMTDEEKDRLRDRTLREARSAARLNHPHVVRIYDVVHAEGLPWIVMEYVPSRSLHQVILEDGPFSPLAAARIGLAVLDALSAAHRAGVLHRDIKPHNVLIGHDGRVVLTDFGLATFVEDGLVTSPGLVVGSPQYVSPERARDGASTVESDLWSLGATLYAAVEGRSPYARESAMATLVALATEEPDPPTLAGPLAPILNGLLRRDPTDRLGADEVEEQLHAIIAADVTSPYSRAPATGRMPIRRPVVPAPRRPADGESAEQTHADESRPAESRPAERHAAGEPERQEATRVRPEPAAALSEPAATLSEPAATLSEPAATLSGPAHSPAAAQAPADPGRSVTTSQAALPAPLSPARHRQITSTSAPPRKAPPGDAAVEPRRPPSRLALVGAVVIALLGAASTGFMAWQQQRDNEGPVPLPAVSTSTGTGGQGGGNFSPSVCDDEPPSGLPQTPQPGAVTGVNGWILIDGFSYFSDRSGFHIAVPDGWTYQQVGTTLCFRDPQGDRFLSVDAERNPAADPVKACRAEAKLLVAEGELPQYKQIGIEPVPLFDRAADWEYTYAGPRDMRMHAMTRWFTLDGKAYALGWATREFDWQVNLSTYSMIRGSFYGSAPPGKRATRSPSGTG